MIGLLELLYGTQKDLTKEQSEYIRQIFGSVNSLREHSLERSPRLFGANFPVVLIINDIIDFNKISGGSVEVARNTFILQDLVEELVTLFSESMSKDGVEFEVDISGIGRSAFGEGTRLMLLGDDAKIRRIVVNMLSNVGYAHNWGLPF